MQNRYDFIYLFDVKDGNPNGDPDAGNLPRVDAETGHGLVTDVALKRKVRNFVGLTHGEQPPYEIYVKEKAVLNRQHMRAYMDCKLKPESKKLPKKQEDAKRVTGFMCSNFFDIRTFGAVMTTEVNCGQVRGPVQLTFGRSVEPVVSAEHSITRMAVTNEKDLEKERTMGRKFTIPYGLYRTHGFVSAPLAEQTGFSDEDLELLWKALEQMFEHDHSAARGQMSARGLLLFKHDDRLGNAPAHGLFDRVIIERTDKAKPARDFSDYRVLFDEKPIDGVVVAGASENLGGGVTLIRRI
ncbi:MAG: type I-C CRISPR-associated protein Cas7/Csd2 [Gammaproteobacteria bacterium]|nr:type I-C CRISPR-associated protein Cas7/Csd2 [Gammaproteobacteria bacterium]